MYPNVFRYIGHIKKTDGFLGMYRGLVPRLLSNIVGSMVCNAVSTELSRQTVESADDSVSQTKENAYEDAKKLVIDVAYESLSKCAGIIASQPLHVIVVRSMCQFVGKETKYSSISSSISEIWEREGIAGFFSGLIPRLIGELLTIWLTTVVMHLFNSYLFPTSQPHSKELRVYSSVFSQMVVTQITYPFNLISNVMAVNNSGLAAGSPPVNAIYSSWWDCWTRLSQQNQLKRGSSMFFRTYRGPVHIGIDGSLVPVLKAQF
jgi:carrier protein